MLFTRGFEDTLALMRGGYAEWSGRPEEEIKNVPYVSRPPTLVPNSLIEGIHERVDVAGTILVPAEADEIQAAAARLLDQGAEAIGICFLWGPRNPANEQLAAEVVRRAYPDVFVATSHDVAPVIGEFERGQTVALTVRLGSAVYDYIRQLGDRLKENSYTGPLLVMQAYGGLLNADAATGKPVGMIESGPVAGLVGSRGLGEVLGYRDVIGVDMGGTTFKAGVITAGTIDYAREPMVERYHYASPKMNIESIGLAGGSIISVDPITGNPRVGPRSAGARPGPVCYDRGGEEPTITDVDLLLGYLDERYFLGGRETLNAAKARDRFNAAVAEPLGMGVEEAAGEVHRLANSMINDMLHKLTVEQGLDPRSYVMFSTGGTAGMHASSFAPQLGVSKLVVPHSASVHAALGLVTSDVAYEEQVTQPQRAPADAETVSGLFAELSSSVRDKLSADGFSESDIVLTRSIEMRYRRQVHVVAAPLNGSDQLAAADLERAVDEFERLYEQRFGAGSGYREAGIELVNFRVRGAGLLRKAQLTGHEKGQADPAAALVESRNAYFATVREFLDANCYDFQKMSPGNQIAGPAIVWTPITTVVINPDQVAVCDEYKNLVISW